MAVLETARISGDKPYIYIIGSGMLADKLQAYAQELDQQTDNGIDIHLLDSDGTVQQLTGASD